MLSDFALYVRMSSNETATFVDRVLTFEANRTVADRLAGRFGIIRDMCRRSTMRVKHTFCSTALPRVGVARPNGSYVARTLSCVLAARFALVLDAAVESSRSLNVHSIKTSGGRRFTTFFPLALYAVAKDNYVRQDAR